MAVPEGVVGSTDLGLRNTVLTLSNEGLTQLSPDGRALPELAERWTWENESHRLRVFLKGGVRFHDGSPLTAERAVGLLREAIDRPSNRMLYTSLSDVTAIRADGSDQIVLELTRPSAFLPEDLELPLALGRERISTGPYRVLRSGDSEVVMERFEQYHGGLPRIEQVIIKGFEARRTAWASLLRGEVDMVNDVPPDAVEFVESQSVQVVSFGTRYQFLVAFNSRRPPFNNPVVRRALNLAVDRDRVVDRVLQGRAKPSTGPLWPQHWAYDASIRPYLFDPALARSMLNAAGFTAETRNGRPNTRFRFTCLIPENYSLIERIGLEVQKQLYNVGIDMQFEVVPVAKFDARIREGAFEAILIDMVSGPSFGRSYMFWASASEIDGLNVFGYENPEAERLFGVLRRSTNEAAVRSATSNLQRVLLDDPPALFLTWNERSRAIRRDFEVVLDPAQHPDPVMTIWRWAPATRSVLAAAFE